MMPDCKRKRQHLPGSGPNPCLLPPPLLQGSELVLEVAEAQLVNVSVEGSLLVYAQNVIGHLQDGGSSSSDGHSNGHSNGHSSSSHHGAHGASTWLELGNNSVSWSRAAQQQRKHSRHSSTAHALPPSAGNPFGGSGSYGSEGQRLVLSSHCGRVSLHNVVVRNRGIDWQHGDNCYWRHQVARHEACRVVLHGRWGCWGAALLLPVAACVQHRPCPGPCGHASSGQPACCTATMPCAAACCQAAHGSRPAHGPTEAAWLLC
jgi:hypothetical protein